MYLSRLNSSFSLHSIGIFSKPFWTLCSLQGREFSAKVSYTEMLESEKISRILRILAFFRERFENRSFALPKKNRQSLSSEFSELLNFFRIINCLVSYKISLWIFIKYIL